MFKSIFSLIICFLSSYGLCAQSSEEMAVKQVITTFFEGMKASDTTLIRNTLYQKVDLQTTYTDKEGNPKIAVDNINNFILAVGKPHTEIYDERITEYVIKVDDNMAIAWTPYQFYLGSNFSHCGVNLFTLFKTASGWKIITIIDTRRKENC